MENVIVRKGRVEDAEYFPDLVLFSAPKFFPSLFGPDVRRVMKNLFKHHGNYFSYEHTYFAELDGKVAGMCLAYNYGCKNREKMRTIFLLIRYLGWSLFMRMYHLLKSQDIVGMVEEKEYYISNIAVYPEFRSAGLGSRLLLEVEREARSTGDNRITLDAETYNKRAIDLYSRHDYDIEWKTRIFKIYGETFEFFRMGKSLEPDGGTV